MKRLHIAPAVVIVGVEQPVATLVGSQVLLVDSIEREEIPRLLLHSCARAEHGQHKDEKGNQFLH